MPTLDHDTSMHRVHRAIEAIKARKMVIMIDEEDRENEGDIVFAAEHATPENINFMAKEARGLICLTMDPPIIDRLNLPMMHDAHKSSSSLGTAFTVSIEAREGVTTGISAQDRAHTIQVAVADDAKPEDLTVPGHVFPLRGKPGGVLERAGHTEGSIDLAKLAGLKGGAVVCEIMNDDGSMARLPDLQVVAKKHDLPIVSIPDLINYRLMQDSLVTAVHRKPFKNEHGEFESVLFASELDGCKHLAFVKGKDFSQCTVEVRVHPQRSLVDIFGAGNERLDYGFKMLAKADQGVLLYLTRPEGQTYFEGEFLELAGEAPSKQEATPGPAMDHRRIGLGAQILRSLGVKKMRVHSGSSRPLKGLSGFDLEVVDTVVMPD